MLQRETSINMKTQILSITIGLVLLSVSTLSCDVKCCNTSTDCCNTSTNCQTTNCCQTTSNCCQTTSNCCQKLSNCCDSCQTRCTTSTCVDQCKQKCATDECRPNNNIESDTNNKNKEVIIDKGASNNINENKFNFTASIHMNNTVNNENRIYIPVNVTNSNFNNVIVTSGEGHQSPEEPRTTDIPPPTYQPQTPSSQAPTQSTISPPSTTPSTVTPCPESSLVPVPIPVPSKPIFIPVPYGIPHVISQPLPGCCIIVNPCSWYGCQPYQRTCGFECTYHFMYRPVNPCEGHCYRRQYTVNRFCYQGGYCQHNLVNCSECNEEFYQSYEGYQQCGGCFYR